MVNHRRRKQLKRHAKAMRARSKLRAAIVGRPRLSVFRSLKNIYVQVIDDMQGKTLAMASTCDKDLQDGLNGLGKTDAAAKVGEAIATRAKAAGVTKVAFDRGRFRFHGRVKALAEAAREGGLEF